MSKKSAKEDSEVNKENSLLLEKKYPHLSEIEKGYLIALVKKYEKIVENKKTNKVFNQEKDLTWKKIEEEFNQNADVTKRSDKNLHKSWDNLKARAKKEYSAERVQLYKTGGGNKKNVVPPSDQSVRVHDIVGPQIDPLVNEFDDDFVAADSSNKRPSKAHSSKSSNIQDSEKEDESEIENNLDGFEMGLPASQRFEVTTITLIEEHSEANPEKSTKKCKDETNKKRKRNKEDELMDMEKYEHDLRCEQAQAKTEQIHAKAKHQKIKFDLKLEVLRAKLAYWNKKNESFIN